MFGQKLLNKSSWEEGLYLFLRIIWNIILKKSDFWFFFLIFADLLQSLQKFPTFPDFPDHSDTLNTLVHID